MSESLLLEHDPVDQPAAADPVERSTWSALRIRIGRRFASRLWDKALKDERTTLYAPVFPVAEWIVQNWWPLLNELSLSETLPQRAIAPRQRKWITRHCLRSADSSLLLPALYIHHDGQSLRAEWQADEQDSMPNMPGEFLERGMAELDATATQDSLAEFVNTVLDRVVQVDDARVRDLKAHWKAIQAADAEERAFCTLAGRMGIDPYDPGEMNDELSRFLEETMTDPDDPLVRDLTEVARPDWVAEQWSWLARVGSELRLGASRLALPFEAPPRTFSPARYGYQLASEARAAAGVQPRLPLESVESIAQGVLGVRFRSEDRNHIPGHGVRAVIGRSQEDGDVVAAGRWPGREDSRRFLSARSLYHALVTTQEGPRLVTDAFSWEQKASRAFAAELLAPRQALLDLAPTSVADPEAIEALAHKFNASTWVIGLQLLNAGVTLSSD